MRYIKEYNEVLLIDELSDYLQELFDSHNIIEKRDDVSHFGDVPSWYIWNRQNQINIVNIPKENYKLLRRDLERLLPLLRKRTGYPIDVSYAEFIGSISIYLEVR